MNNSNPHYYKYVQQALALAHTSVAELSIAQHQQRYTHLIVELDNDNNIIDAWITYTADGYYCNADNNIHSVYSAGNSVPCNCDACVNGDNPEDWAGDTEHCDGIEDVILEKITELLDYNR